MMKNQDKDDHFLITFSDVIYLFKSSRKMIFTTILCCGLMGALFALTRPIQYQAEGTFREKSKKSGQLSSSILSMLGNEIAGAQENEAAQMIKSRKLLSDVIARLNLQGQLHSKSHSEDVFSLIGSNLKLAWFSFLKKREPALSDFKEPLKIDYIHYEGEIPLDLEIALSEQGKYEVRNPKSSIPLLGVGEVDQPFIHDSLFLVLSETGGGGTQPQSFSLHVEPVVDCVKHLCEKMNVENTKTDKGVLKIIFDHRNRHLASSFINTTMECYQIYLQNYHNKLSQLQLNYLNSRQEQLAENLSKTMQKHADYLTHDLSNAGFIDSENEMEFLAKNQHEYKEWLLSNELEIKRIESSQADLKAHQDLTKLENNPVALSDVLKEMNNNSQIGLETSKELYADYSKELVKLESSIRQYNFFIQQMGDTSFEITSLSSVAQDAVIDKIIEKASELILRLHDQSNQSIRDQERVKEELSLQKSFLLMHLQQTVQLMELDKQLIQEKLYALQNVRLENLRQERILINEHLKHINNEMVSLPQKWIAEQMIEQEVETNQLIVAEISKLVESKNIAQNLEMIQSAPIDNAIPPLHPLPPRLLLYTILGLFFGGLLGSAATFANALKHGLRASMDNLRLLGYHVIGRFSQSYDAESSNPVGNEDLELLRRLQSYLDPKLLSGQLLLLVEGSGPDYSRDLADLLSRKNKKLLRIYLDFRFTEERSKEGLLSYLEGDSSFPSIQTDSHGDLIVSGGITRFSTELLGSEAFRVLIEKLKSTYDLIIGITHQTMISAEAESLLPLFPNVAVTITDENIEDLMKFSDVFTDPQRKTAFIFQS